MTSLNLSNPFKRSVDQKRAVDGKFTAGSGGLQALKKFNWKRALPVVVIIALLGGFFVVKSFAGVSAGSYQYSVYSKCNHQARADNVAEKDKTCLDDSAEAAVYRSYKTVLGRYPAAGDYKSWVQPMVGGDATSATTPGRMSYEVVVKRLLATDEAKKKGLLSGDTADQAIINKLFTNALNRQASSSDVSYWVNYKKANKWDVEQLVRHFANSKEALAKQRASFIGAMNASPSRVGKVAVVDYAKRRMDNRLSLANKTNKNNTTTLNQTKERNADNRKRLATAQGIANQAGKDISKGEYESIKNNNANVIQARVNGFKGAEYMGRVNTRLEQIKKLNDTVNEVRRASPDLVTSDKMQREYNYAVYVRDQMNREIEHAQWLHGETMRNYNAAKYKYDQHQAWLRLQAQIAACRNQGGSWQGNRCVMPQAPTSGSGEESEDSQDPSRDTESDVSRDEAAGIRACENQPDRAENRTLNGMRQRRTGERRYSHGNCLTVWTPWRNVGPININ